MAYRIHESVVQVEIDNRLKGHVMGKVWLLGRNEPVKLNLKGNCLKDMAGYKMTFNNPSPTPRDDVDGLHKMQQEMLALMKRFRNMPQM